MTSAEFEFVDAADGWAAPISDDAAELLQRLVDQHRPGRYGWCRCGRPGCNRLVEFEVQLAIAGRMDLPLPWVARPESGRW